MVISISDLTPFIQRIREKLDKANLESEPLLVKSRERFSDLFKNLESEQELTNENLALILILSFMVVENLERFLNLNPQNPPSISFVSNMAMQNGIHIDQNVLKLLEFSIDTISSTSLDFHDIRKIALEFSTDKFIIEDRLGSFVQSLLLPQLRKTLAANYTSTVSSKLLSSLALNGDLNMIIDPFAGSGRLITSTLEETVIKQRNIPEICINELHEAALLLAIVRVLYTCQKHNIKLQMRFLMGDAFGKLSLLLSHNNHTLKFFDTYDLVIMNPPFTRYLRLTPKFLELLNERYYKYEKFFRQQMGLHVFALFLGDAILRPRGRLATILPASTFYSKYSTGLMKFLLKNYSNLILVGISAEKAFSEGSDFKEIIFIADKRNKNEEDKKEVLFANIENSVSIENYSQISQLIQARSSTEELRISYNQISYEKLEKEWNWIRFLDRGHLPDLSSKIKQMMKIVRAEDIGLRIVRGFEMYGPEFFFLPNKTWLLDKRTEEETWFKHSWTKDICKFPNQILIPALRKPGLYAQSISPSINHYVLRVPPEDTNLVPESYLKERHNEWQVARKRFGRNWLNHIDNQLKSKQPFSHLFVADKFGITTTGTFVYFTEDRITASKNFYIIDCEKEEAEFLAAWMSSTFFLLLFLASRREIGGAFGRLQIVDYKAEELFFDHNTISENKRELIIGKFRNLKKKQLPPIKTQVAESYRQTLDRAFLDAIDLKDSNEFELLDKIYSEIQSIFNEIDNRGKKRRERE